MSESGDPGNSAATVRVEDIERALVLAREVAAATAKGGAANLRMEHLLALFANGNGPPPAARIQAALEAAGLEVEPALTDAPQTVTLRVSRGRAALASKGAGARGRAARATPPPAAASGDDPSPRLTGVDAYRAAGGNAPHAAEAAPGVPAGVPLADAQRRVAGEQAQHNTPQSLAALLMATIVPVLAASFLGPLFGASFAGLALIASALLSRPGALADGRMGPIRMPASLARSYLLVSFGVALGALLTSVALVAAGGRETQSVGEDTPIEQPAPPRPEPQTTPPAPPSARERREAREERRERAERRRERRERAERRRERAQQEEEQQQQQQQDAPPPSGATPEPAP